MQENLCGGGIISLFGVCRVSVCVPKYFTKFEIITPCEIFTMKSSDTILVGISSLLFVIANNVDAIKCFQCNSYNEGCSSLTERDIDSQYLQDCENDHSSPPFCRKTIQTIINSNNLVRITRSCGWLTALPASNRNGTKCTNNDTQFKFDVTCECHTNGCNSAPETIAKSIFLKYASLIFIILAMKAA